MKLAQIVASMREDCLDWNNLKGRNQLEDLGVEGTNSEKKSGSEPSDGDIQATSYIVQIVLFRDLRN